ncbi:hypothetical protein ACFLS5_05115 [Candidatus Bipolaricaulota bacterium]
MKRSGLLILLMTVVAGLSVAAWGLTLCEYRSPVTALADARASFAYRYYNDAATSVVDVDSGRLALNYDQLYDSASYGFTLGGSAELTLDEFSPTGWLAQGAGTLRLYPWEGSHLFAFGGVEGAIATGQPRPGVEVLVGAGIGRFSDVTPLAKAIAMQSTVGDLPDEVLMAIAETLGRAAEYETLKEMVSDIEALIEGATGSVLGARELLTIEEVILATGDDRKCGWALQGGIGYELIDPYGGAQNIVVGVSADAAFATGPDDQLLFRASCSGPFDIMNENRLTAGLSYERILTENGTMIADYALQRVKPAELEASTSHLAGLSLGFDIGGVDVGLQISLSREPGDPGWSIDVSVAATMDLL